MATSASALWELWGPRKEPPDPGGETVLGDYEELPSTKTSFPSTPSKVPAYEAISEVPPPLPSDCSHMNDTKQDQQKNHSAEPHLTHRTVRNNKMTIVLSR